MNKTKKLTQGAMLLAIVGALMVLDREFGFLFSDMIVLAMPVMIIFYSTKYEIRDGLVLSVCLIILSIILGNITSYAILPTAIIVGVAYSFGLKKEFSKRKLLALSMIIYIIGEVLTMLVVLPLLGIDYMALELQAAEQAYEQTSKLMGVASTTLINSLSSNFVIVMIIVAIIITSLAEGWIVHMFSIMILTRFKVKEIKKDSLLDFKMSKILAYVLFLATFGLIFILKLDASNEILFYFVASASIISAFVLIYVGYLFIINYGVVVLHKNLTLIGILLVLLLLPFSIIALIVIGFLYGAGPLYDFLQKKRNINNEESN